MPDIVIEWTKKAYKELKKLPESKEIYLAVQGLRNWPDCRNVKKLTGREEYRLRTGRYRVIFSVIDRKPKIIRIEKVGKRDEHTY